jgi:hypothetical protein
MYFKFYRKSLENKGKSNVFKAFSLGGEGEI